MNEFKKDIQEDAKSDWMKIVNKHKKRQKGLPALSTLNTNAGNVEYNIEMFNMMNTPAGEPSGTEFSSSSDSTGMLESVNEDLVMNENIEEKVELEYENIPVEVVVRRGNSSGYYNHSLGGWLPDEDETEEILIDWTYIVDKQFVIEYLQDDPEVQLELGADSLTDEEFDKKLHNNLEDLVDTHMQKLLDYFRDDAIADAQENYEYEEDDIEYDRIDENVNISSLDDNFDMSMRTLL